MATPTLTLINHTELDDADVSTGWSNLTTADTDIKVEGSASMSGITRSDGEDSYFDAGGAPVTAVGKVLRGWVNTTNIPYMDTEAADPYKLWCFDGSAQSNGLALFGSDTYPGGWFYFWQDMDDFTGVTLANVDRWGIEAGHTGSSKNVINMWMDVLRYLDGYYFTGGTSGDKVTLADVATADKGTTTLYGYGIVRENFEVYFCTGEVQVGNGATTTYFEMDGEVLVFLDTPGALTIAAGLYELNVQGSGCNAVIKNSVLRANGTTDATRFVLDLSDTSATVECFDNLITRAAATTCASGQDMTGNVFDDCGVIAANGADFSGSVVKNYEGTADTSGFVWNVATDPDTLTEGMTFIKGTAATHALELGTTSPLSVTLTDVTFTGYGADTTTSAAIHVKRTSGTVTINIDGGSTPTYKSAGATVVIVNAGTATFTPVENGSAFTITKDSDNSVLLDVASVTGGEQAYSFDRALIGTATTVHIIMAGEVPIDFPWSIDEGTVPISQVTDRVYNNP